MDSQPPKRQKLPLHLHLHQDEPQHQNQTDDTSFPPTNFNSNQLLPLTNTPSFSPPDDARATLSLSLSSDRRCYDVDRQDLVWKSSVPLGPFTGYASILNRSRFSKPAQDLLDELCGVDSSVFNPNYSFQGFCEDGLDLIHNCESVRNTCKESNLILILDEVFKRYKQYYQHLQSVVASFEAVCGLGNAAPYILFALRTMAQQFSSLKKTLFERAQSAGEEVGYTSISNVAPGCQDSYTRCERLKPVQTSPGNQHPVWRSQRGLPAYAVAVFKNWLFEHFLHPYPSDTDKNLLAQQTGLSRNQVSNWFINARVRLWKPLVEEIHTLDEQQGQTALKKDLKTSRTTMLHQPPSALSVDHQAQIVPLQMSLGKQCHNKFVPSCSESSTYYHSPYAMKHTGEPDENMDISLALGLQQNDVSGNSDAHNHVNLH